ncbi:hypothetical protein NQ318_018892 [Aromia moschata]|uniref:Uncharacterized protein n=1 Tax=Aromia moschata TaxID=1265417 RepID=A0AAV8ZIU7_9CUCU|nr:hypothetical protein NQ318_018892 [Aromia moschata]
MLKCVKQYRIFNSVDELQNFDGVDDFKQFYSHVPLTSVDAENFILVYADFTGPKYGPDGKDLIIYQSTLLGT